MNPYYQDDHVTLYHADCLQHLDVLDQADVLVTDPPYGVAYQSCRVPSRIDRPIKNDHDVTARDEVLRAWGNKPAIVFGTWRRDRPKNTRQRLIWSKGSDPGMGDLKMPWGNSDEEIYVLGNGWLGKRTSNVLTFPKPPVSNRPDHPTPKPVPLMEKLITACPESWTIIDPFAGSGSTLRAAKNLGRKCIGFEIEEKYCEITAQRLAQETLGIF